MGDNGLNSGSQTAQKRLAFAMYDSPAILKGFERREPTAYEPVEKEARPAPFMYDSAKILEIAAARESVALQKPQAETAVTAVVDDKVQITGDMALQTSKHAGMPVAKTQSLINSAELAVNVPSGSPQITVNTAYGGWRIHQSVREVGHKFTESVAHVDGKPTAEITTAVTEVAHKKSTSEWAPGTTAMAPWEAEKLRNRMKVLKVRKQRDLESRVLGSVAPVKRSFISRFTDVLGIGKRLGTKGRPI